MRSIGGLGFLRLTLPLELCVDAPGKMIELGLRLTSKLKILTGYGGICLATYMYPAWQEGGPLYVLSRRHTGVDFADPYRFREYQRFGLNAVNWLTWVGESFLSRLGGRNGLRGVIVPPLVVHELPEGIMLQAGTEAAWGDVNRGERLEPYHAAGRTLKPVRFPVEALGKHGPIGGSENTRTWFSGLTSDMTRPPFKLDFGVPSDVADYQLLLRLHPSTNPELNPFTGEPDTLNPSDEMVTLFAKCVEGQMFRPRAGFARSRFELVKGGRGAPGTVWNYEFRVQALPPESFVLLALLTQALYRGDPLPDWN